MKTKTIVILIVSAIGVLFIAGVASCAGVLFSAYRSLDQTLSPAVDELFAAIDNDTFVDTYDTHTTAEFQGVTTRKQYEDMGLSIKTRLGALKSKSLRQFNVRQMNADRYADVTYNATFEKGSGVISGRFRKVGEKWLIIAFNVNSSEFQKDLATGKCPHCGEPHTSEAKFCPKCGKPLAGDDPSAGSTRNLYVGNFPYSATADDLREAFSKYGVVKSVEVVVDRETGRSRGFGFVEMSEGADEVIAGLSGSDFGGRMIIVSEAAHGRDVSLPGETGDPSK